MGIAREILEIVLDRFQSSLDASEATGHFFLGEALADAILILKGVRDAVSESDADLFDGDQNSDLRDAFNIVQSVAIGDAAGIAILRAASPLVSMAVGGTLAGPGVAIFGVILVGGLAVDAVLDQLSEAGLSLIRAQIDLSGTSEPKSFIIGSALGDQIITTTGSDSQVSGGLGDDIFVNS